MNRRLLNVVVVLAVVLASTGVSYGFSSFATAFKSAYSASPLSQLSTTSGVTGNLCTVCHGRSGPPLNLYGEAFLANGTVFAGLDNLDSDGDTFSNITEITAGTFPGDPNSKPSVADTTAPTVTAFSIPTTATSLTVAISTFTATDTVGVTGYLVNESATKPLATAAGWSAAVPANYTFASAGAKTLYGWAKDAAGNVSASLSDTVTITLPDTIAPTVTAFSIPTTAASLTVAISTFTATDTVGVTGYLVNESATKPLATAAGWSAAVPANYTFASEGARTLYGWAKDAAGNVSASLSDTVTVTLPVNRPPTVDAGANVDPAFETRNVTLHAVANDLDGDTLTYAWAQTAGKAVSYVGPTNAADVTFTVPVVGTVSQTGLTFQVTVNDGKGGVISDTVNVRVRLMGDNNADDTTDVIDLLSVVYSFGLSTGASGFDSAADFNKDGQVDMADLLNIVNNFGRRL